MIKNFYNKNEIVSIRVYDKEPVPSIKYKEGNLNSIWSFLWKIEPGFYYIISGNRVPLEDMEDLIIDYENKLVYYLPYVKISFSNGNHKFLPFASFKECIDYVNSFVKEHELSDVMISFS